MQDKTPEFGQATMTDCDREPIHIPGEIQPHGVLLVLSEPDLVILQASDNMRRHLDLISERMLGLDLSLILDDAAMAAVRLALGEDLTKPRYLDPLDTSSGLRMEAIIHRTEAGILLELEPFAAERELNLPQLFRVMLSAVHDAPSLAAACNEAVRHLRGITGFDRVMIYRFLDSGAGAVIAEDRRADLPSFLDLRYPATDIPAQARRLLTLNPLRVWAGTERKTASLLPRLNPATGQPLDMSRCVLRAASPIHLEYLRNMGVAASMTLSITRGGKLWGLIACHHATPRRVPYVQRIVCESLGHLLGLQIEAKERDEAAAELNRLHNWTVNALRILGSGESAARILHSLGPTLLDFVAAAGVVVHQDGSSASFGEAPDEREIEALVRQLAAGHADEVVASDSAGPEFPGFPAGPDKSLCGFLALPTSMNPQDWIIWFRKEVVTAISWAGDPAKPMGEEAERLTPRSSFAAWRETVRGISEPWSDYEIQASSTLRSALMDLAVSAAGRSRRSDSPTQGEARVTEAVDAATAANERMRQLVASLAGLAEALRRR